MLPISWYQYLCVWQDILPKKLIQFSVGAVIICVCFIWSKFRIRNNNSLSYYFFSGGCFLLSLWFSSAHSQCSAWALYLKLLNPPPRGSHLFIAKAGFGLRHRDVSVFLGQRQIPTWRAWRFSFASPAVHGLVHWGLLGLAVGNVPLWSHVSETSCRRSTPCRLLAPQMHRTWGPFKGWMWEGEGELLTPAHCGFHFTENHFCCKQWPKDGTRPVLH